MPDIEFNLGDQLPPVSVSVKPEDVERWRAFMEHHQRLLELVKRGVERGVVKAQPIINPDPNATSLEVQSLAQVADAAIKR